MNIRTVSTKFIELCWHQILVPDRLCIYVNQWNIAAMKVSPLLPFSLSVEVTVQAKLDEKFINFFLNCKNLYFGHLCDMTGIQYTEIFEKNCEGDTEIKTISLPKYHSLEVEGFLAMRERGYFVDIYNSPL